MHISTQIFSELFSKENLWLSTSFCTKLLPLVFLTFIRQDCADGEAAASYLEDPGSNPAIGMKNMHHAAACLVQLWYIKSLCKGRTTEYQCTWLMITQMNEQQK